MIYLGKRLVIPVGIARMQLGKRVIYTNGAAWLNSSGVMELDLEATPRSTVSAPAESEEDVQLLLDTGLETVASAATEADVSVGITWEGELYVHPNSVMATNEPLHLTSESQANAVSAAVFAATEGLTITPEVQANAPAVAPCEAEEPMQVSADAQGAAPEAAPMAAAPVLGTITGAHEMIAAQTAPAELAEALKLPGPGELQISDAAALAALLGLDMELAAELWVKNELWVAPVLYRQVLGVTQAHSAVLTGSTLRIS
jgi:hypothetical protein